MMLKIKGETGLSDLPLSIDNISSKLSALSATHLRAGQQLETHLLNFKQALLVQRLFPTQKLEATLSHHSQLKLADRCEAGVRP